MNGNSSGQTCAGVSSYATAVAPAPEIERRQAASPIEKLPPTRQFKLAITRVAILLAIVFTVRYFYWRLFNTMNPAARVFFYAFLLAEVLSFIESALFYFVAWDPTHYARPEGLPGRSVDVFICTYNEPVELLRETVVCAVHMSYPHKTWILDDGARPEVRALAEEFKCGYLVRPDRKDAKAGNLNHALARTHAEFIVTLDADHVASPELIEEMIGFFSDSTIAGVQANQDFYNLDSFQHRVNWDTRAGWQQQELFFSVIQPGKDRHNAAFYCGSPAILRRSALEEIGGFATGTITEDMHTSLRLQKQGWRVLYINRTVARGLAPQTFTGFANQWQRWGHGAMQVMRMERPVLGPGNLTFQQRLSYFSSIYFYWMSYQKLLYMLTPIFSLFFSVFALVTDPFSYASFFLPYFTLNLACSILLQGGFRNFLLGEKFNILKMHVLLRSPSGLLQRETAFKVTPKSRAGAAPFSQIMLPSVLLVGLVASLITGAVRITEVPLWGYFFWALIVNIFWGIVFLYMVCDVLWHAIRRKEMRATYRFPGHMDVRMRVSYEEARGVTVTHEHYARNLNRFGASVTLENPIPAGTPVNLELRLPHRNIHAAGRVVRNQSYGSNGKSRIANGIQFEQIAPADQDEISKYLFWQVAPRDASVLHLTRRTQAEAES